MAVPFLGGSTAGGSVGYSNDAPTVSGTGPNQSGAASTGDFVFGNKSSALSYQTILFAGIAIFILCIALKKHKV